MFPRYNNAENNVLAMCPDCNAVTSFDNRAYNPAGPVTLGTVIINQAPVFKGHPYSRTLWQFLRCNSCSRGAVAKIYDNGNSAGAVLASFVPAAVESAKLPAKVPADLVAEFKEAELVASVGAFRAASAMLRSVLEKALKKNGYDEVDFLDRKGNSQKSRNLDRRIDAAAGDGVITEARKLRAHENIRVLGNDILHDDWRQVTCDEYEDAHLYSQRILEDLYDNRDTVEAILKSKNRNFQGMPATPPATSPTAPVSAAPPPPKTV